MKRRRGLVTFVFGASALAAMTGAGVFGGYRVNLTPSYPIGLWRIVPFDHEPRIGDLVFICPPLTPTFLTALERGYLRHGLCPGGFAPLIKAIAATEGQRVVVATSVTVDGRPLPHSEVRSLDGADRPLAAYAGGVVPAGYLLVHSPHEGSYDSRYFAPIPASGLLGRAKPIFTIEP